MSRLDIQRLSLAGGIQEIRRRRDAFRRRLLIVMASAVVLGNIAWLIVRAASGETEFRPCSSQGQALSPTGQAELGREAQ